MRVLVALAALLGVSAHICMWEPLQRSAFDISQPGSNPCYLKPPPCGGIPYKAGGPLTKLVAGSTFTVEFQQNLNHYYVGGPGYLEVSIADGNNPTEQQFSRVGQIVNDYNSMNMITQTNFSIQIQVPEQPCTACVLRARYLSNNPLENDRGEVFHQCADVQIVTSAEADAETLEYAAKHAAKNAAAPSKTLVDHTMLLPGARRHASASASASASAADAPAGCCTAARQWTVQWEETGSYRQSTNGVTYYDAVNKLMRVDTESGAGTGTTIYDGSFVMYLNFTSGIEYYLNTVTNVCEPLGLDLWNDWCYGTVNQTETYVESLTVGQTGVNIWQNGEFFFGGTNDSTCTPFLLTRPTKGMMTLYYNYETGAPDPALFVPPANCHLSLEAARASGKPLRRAPIEHRHHHRGW